MLLLSDLTAILRWCFIPDFTSDEAIYRLAGEFEAKARIVAANMGDRIEAIAQAVRIRKDHARRLSHLGPMTDLPHQLDDLWRTLEGYFDLRFPTPRIEGVSEAAFIHLATMVAKFEMNFVAGLYEAQVYFIQDHPTAICHIIFAITNFARIENPEYFRLQAMLTQLISNLVSPVSQSAEHQQMIESEYKAYLCGDREEDVITRLLDTPDPKVMLATLRYIHNIVRSSPERQQGLITPSGVRWLPRILSRMEEWNDTTAEDTRFEVACSINDCYLFSESYGHLFDSLNADKVEVVTPAQTALLKLLDSHLHNRAQSNTSDPNPNAFLVSTFTSWHRYATISLSSGQDDARLPKVLEGLVLVLECLGTIVLACQARRDRNEHNPTGGEEAIVAQLKAADGKYISCIITLLQYLETKLPNLRQSAAAAKPVSDKPPTERYLGGIKVSLVRLLGALSYNDTSVGDAVRWSNGIEVVLSLTQVDEHNPYLREHALFTVRNLMRDNPANQAVVKEMGPIGVLSETGEVLPVPDKMKKVPNGSETSNGTLS